MPKTRPCEHRRSGAGVYTSALLDLDARSESITERHTRRGRQRPFRRCRCAVVLQHFAALPASEEHKVPLLHSCRKHRMRVGVKEEVWAHFVTKSRLLPATPNHLLQP